MTDGDGEFRINVSSLRDEVYDLLRDRILRREFPPGFRFDLSRLETQMGVSRTPLKEALHRLQAEGLVEIHARRGTFVADIDPDVIIDNFEVRCALQVHAVKIALATSTDEEIKGIRDLVDAMHNVAQNYSFEEGLEQYLSLDRKFHQAIVGLSRNQRLLETHDQSDVYVHFARMRRDFGTPDLTATEQEHEQIMAALERRDQDAAVKAIEHHTRQSKTRMAKVL